MPPWAVWKNTPPGTRGWKWMLRLRAEPKRRMKVTAPHKGSLIPCLRAHRRCQANSARKNRGHSQANQLGLPGEQRAQAFGHRADPLAKRDCRKDRVAQVGGRVCHSTCRTGRTDAAVFAGKCNEQLVAAGRAADAGEAVFQNTAAQVALELALNEVRSSPLGYRSAASVSKEARFSRTS